MQKSVALTATEFINEELNICWITFKIKFDFFGKLYILYKNVQKHYYTIIVKLVNSEVLYKLFWNESTQINHKINTDIITFNRIICVWKNVIKCMNDWV